MFESLSSQRDWPVRPLAYGIRINKESRFQIDDLEEYRILGVTNRGGGVAIKRTVRGSDLTMREYQRAAANQLMWCKVDTKNGAFGVTRGEHAGCLASLNMCLADIDTGVIDPNFLQFFFQLPTVADELTQASLGTTNRQYLKPQELLETVRFRLPPLAEQQRIVARIEELAAKIEEARTLRQQTTEEAEALRSAGQKPFFGAAAYQFGMSRLGDLTKRITKGESPEWQGFTYQGDGPLFIRSENVLWGILDARNAAHIPEAFHNKLSRSQLHAGDVLINLVGASIGRACSVPEGLGAANVNQAVAVITPKSETLLPEFLVHYLLNPIAQDAIHGGKVETARPNISLGDLRDLEVPLPPLPEQHRIVDALDALQAEVDALKCLQAETAAELDAMLPSVLDKAFKGDL